MARRRAQNQKSNPMANMCCCICCMLIAPPIILIIGIVILVVPNSRIARIEEYNRRALIWNNSGIDEFRGQAFTATFGGKALTFTADSSTSGAHYPMADACSKKNDPPCLSAESMSYRTSSTYSGSTLSVALGGTSIQDSVSSTSYYTLSESDLDCSDDTSQCRSACTRRGGEWSGSTCRVTTYLSNICYRVKKEGGKWVHDTNSEYSWFGGSGYGCYYSSGTKIATYSTYHSSSVTVEIRSYKDAFLAADDQTLGCSRSNPSSSSCFGISKSEQVGAGLTVFVVGLILLIGEIVAAVAILMCCKGSISMFKKNPEERAMLQGNPYAQSAGYAQSPAYGQAYMPTVQYA